METRKRIKQCSWDDLGLNLLGEIKKKLYWGDHARFNCVCKTWMAAEHEKRAGDVLPWCLLLYRHWRSLMYINRITYHLYQPLNLDQPVLTRHIDLGMDRCVGLVYDESMCGHFSTTDLDVLERPQRIRSIWERLVSEGVTDRCTILGANKAEDKCIARVHTKNHIKLIKTVAKDRKRDVVAAKLDSIYFNEGSAKAAYIAAGSVIRAAEAVAEGGLDSSFAIVRPPGHHAEVDKPMGFCLFNNIAIAASVLLDTRPELGIKKILIVDWDVHHRNGTQKMFWKDPRVLYFSVHRYDDGKFYPCTIDGSHIMIGEGPGAGYTINVPWQGAGCGDADYNAVWDEILMPVARKFDPNLVMVSAGFDVAVGDPLGGCNVTPRGYGVMLKKLMELADGKLVMALEGGYNIESLEESSLACVKVLLGDTILSSFEERPLDSTHQLINVVRKN